MNAGLPGTGLGGLFYLIGALWMPVSALRRRSRRGARPAWRLVARQFGIAIGVFAALWVTGWGIGYLIAVDVRNGLATTGAGAAPTAIRNVIHWVSLLGTAGLLATIILAVQVLRLVVRAPGERWVPRSSEPPLIDMHRLDGSAIPEPKRLEVA